MRKKKQFVPFVFTIRNILERSEPRSAIAESDLGRVIAGVAARPTLRAREWQRALERLWRTFL